MCFGSLSFITEPSFGCHFRNQPNYWWCYDWTCMFTQKVSFDCCWSILHRIVYLHSLSVSLSSLIGGQNNIILITHIHTRFDIVVYLLRNNNSFVFRSNCSQRSLMLIHSYFMRAIACTEVNILYVFTGPTNVRVRPLFFFVCFVEYSCVCRFRSYFAAIKVYVINYCEFVSFKYILWHNIVSESVTWNLSFAEHSVSFLTVFFQFSILSHRSIYLVFCVMCPFCIVASST